MKRSRTHQILAAICVLLLANSVLSDSNRQVKVKVEINSISSVLELFKLGYCRFPTQSEGLEVLVYPDQSTTPPTPPCQPTTFSYLRKIPMDPWGNPIHYRFPGIHNPGGFDLWTLGADGVVGGLGPNRDRGNWERAEGFQLADLSFTYAVWLTILVPGLVIGFPLFAFHSVKRYRVNQNFRESLIGDHLRIFAYIFFWTAFLLLVINLIFS